MMTPRDVNSTPTQRPCTTQLPYMGVMIYYVTPFTTPLQTVGLLSL